ncbi:hypothetical protein C4588_04710 [Candidatus Parcubacteria bacterium]|nr:MAG: hypothetical protein C4588_04710 [Candidatus Parcubacteria bacterium]
MSFKEFWHKYEIEIANATYTPSIEHRQGRLRRFLARLRDLLLVRLLGHDGRSYASPYAMARIIFELVTKEQKITDS